MLCKDIQFYCKNPQSLHKYSSIPPHIVQNAPISALALCKTSLRFRCGSEERGLNGYDGLNADFIFTHHSPIILIS